MSGAIDIPEFFQTAAERCGFHRDVYVEADLPTNLSNVTIMPFFGDERSQFILSTLLLHRYLGNFKSGRYFILCSHPGLAGMFPYVDEYWSIADPAAAREIRDKAEGAETVSDKAVVIRRSLREHFRDIVTWEQDFAGFYDAGLTANFFDTFGEVQLALPSLRSLKMEINRQINNLSGHKVFVHPTKIVKVWQNEYKTIRTDKGFWKDLYVRLLDAGVVPVVWQTQDCHDLSADFAGKCVFFNDQNIVDVLAAMRACHCVLDIHNGISRYAAIARCPYLCIEERHKFSGLKDYELDDLCVLNKVYRYIFSFATMLQSQRWGSLLDNIAIKLKDVLPLINRDEWPTASEFVSSISYGTVRAKKSKRIGARFVKVPRM